MVSLTFDDGAEDQFVNARPVLLAHGMPATFYVISGRVDSDPNSLTSAQLRTLAAGRSPIPARTPGSRIRPISGAGAVTA